MLCQKKDVTKKILIKEKKEKQIDKKLVVRWSKEISERKKKNAIQRWFFSLEEREQKLLETSYFVVMQESPKLTWEDYLKHLKIADNCNDTAKVVIKKASKILHL